MTEDYGYEAAIAAALAVIHELAERPCMSRPEKLSTITFIILHAMRRLEEQPRRRSPEPSIN